MKWILSRDEICFLGVGITAREYENYFCMTQADFAPWDGKVLLILSEDDAAFSPACKRDLIALMPHLAVVTDLTGGHLALLVRLEAYTELVTDFIKAHTCIIDKRLE